jgi:hypothetical protein
MDGRTHRLIGADAALGAPWHAAGPSAPQDRPLDMADVELAPVVLARRLRADVGLRHPMCGQGFDLATPHPGWLMGRASHVVQSRPGGVTAARQQSPALASLDRRPAPVER